MSWIPTLLAVAEVVSSPADAVQQAQQELASRLHEEGRYAEAARLLEELLGQPGTEPHIAYDAGQSRMAAGHRAHAWRDFRAYLKTPGLSMEDRAIGEPMSLVLELKPDAPPVSPATTGLDRNAGRAETIAGAVILPLGLAALGGVVGVAVTYRHTRSEFEPLRAKFEQGVCLSDEVMRLEDLSISARRQQGALIGLGVVAGVLIGTGAALLVHGRARTKSRVALDLRPGLTGLTLTGRF